MRARLWLLAVAGCVSVSAGCFQIDEPEPEPEVNGAALTGRIIVVGSQGAQSTGVSQALQRTRNAIAQLAAGDDVTSAQLALTGERVHESEPREDLAPTRRRPLREAPPMASPKLEWREGEALVLFEKGRYADKSEAQAAVDRVVARAVAEAPSLARGSVTVGSCTARWFCLVRVDDESGKPLSLEETTLVAKAMHHARGEELRVVSRNFIKRALRYPNDPNFQHQWHFDFARLPAAWDITTGDDNVVVAVIDSGLRLSHPDILGRVVQGADLISDPRIAGDGNGRDPDPTDPGDQALGGGRSSWHGTHVTGIIGAATNNGQGVAGVMWQGKMQPVRVLGLGAQGTDFDILSGVLWSVGDPDVEGVPRNTSPAKVINMSLGGPSDAQGTQQWTEILREITETQKEQYGRPIFITAAGNTNEDVANMVPANIPGVITVGATRYDGRRAEYSNWGEEIDVMAPGGQMNVDQNLDGLPDGILSLFGTGYDFEQGTSMAAPHVSGIVGLLVSIVPELDQATAQQILRDSARPGGICNEGCGTGHVDASAALLRAGGVVQQQPLLAVDVTRLIYQPSVTEMPVSVLNLGDAPLTWTTEIVGGQASLFSVSPTTGSLAPASVSEIWVTLRRGEFESGSANLQVIGTGDAANQVVRVDLFFNDQAVPVQTDLNAVAVMAYRVKDEAGNLELAGESKALRQADFNWRIEGLDPGTYYVFAIGDDDNDGIFDPQRESFGAWPMSTGPTAIEVLEGKTYTGIDFGLSGGFRIDGEGAVGAPCTDALDCSFAGDAQCLPWAGGYCTRECDDGFCGAGASCEILECGPGNPCNVCLSACVTTDGQCRQSEGYVCDAFGTCTPDGF